MGEITTYFPMGGKTHTQEIQEESYQGPVFPELKYVCVSI